MSTDYFESLRAHGNRFDREIDRLKDTWKAPSIVIRGYGTNSSEAVASANALCSSIENVQEQMTGDAASREENISEMDAFLEEARSKYESIVEQCEDIKSVLMEYGYVQVQQETSIDRTNTTNNTESSLISLDVTDDLLEVEFTPDMKWRQKPKVNATSPLREMQDSDGNIGVSQSASKQIGIATPVIKSLASVKEIQTPTAMNVSKICTPFRKCPQAPTFSSHFYNLMKE